AIEAGFRDSAAVNNSSILDQLRQRDDVKQLIAQIERKEKEASEAQAKSIAKNELPTRSSSVKAAPATGTNLQRYQSDLATSEHPVALVQFGLGDKEDAHKSIRQVIQLREALTRGNPNDPVLKSSLADSYFASALILSDLGRSEEAREALTHAVLIPKALVELEPENLEYRARLVPRLTSVGKLYWQGGQLSAATESWNSAREAWKGLVIDSQNSHPEWGIAIANSASAIVKDYGQAGLWIEAADVCESVSHLPINDQRRLDEFLFNAALMRLRAGDLEGYKRVCDK